MLPRILGAFTLLAGAAVCIAQPQSRPSVFYDPAVRPVAFAAAEIARATPNGTLELALDRRSSAVCSPCIVLASGEQATAVARDLGVAPARSNSPQSYAIRRTTRAGRETVVVLAPEPN